MQVAFTADVHLHSDFPERSKALESILIQLEIRGIEHLVIAGDLLHGETSSSSLHELEGLSGNHPSIRLLVIPGNHDTNLRDGQIAQGNITIYHESTCLSLGGSTILLIPYAPSLMGKEIAEKIDDITDEKWILVGHGDYMSGVREPNAQEPGVYMPLTREDLVMHDPAKVILGHIHKPTPLTTPLDGRVLYPGSPHGLDISETGRRRFLIYDTESRNFQEERITTETIFLQEHFFIFPSNNEDILLRDTVCQRIHSWEIDETEYSKIRVRVHASGYSRNRSAIKNTLLEQFAAYGIDFYNGEEPKLETLHDATDNPQRDALAEQAMKELENTPLLFNGDQPSFEQTQLVVLHTIYSTGPVRGR